MNSVFVATPSTITLKNLATLAEKDWHTRMSEDRFVIEDENNYLIIRPAENLKEELNDQEIATVLKITGSTTFYEFSYRDINLIKMVLLTVADSDDFAVDDDHGTLLSGSEFSQRIRENPDLDWRKDWEERRLRGEFDE